MFLHLFLIVFELTRLQVWLEKMKDTGYTIYVTTLSEGSVDLGKVEIARDKPFVIVFGNEGDGVTKKVEELADHKVGIESKGDVDSFNVCVSVGIVGYWLNINAFGS